jgi:hypothetical protein
MSSGSQLIEIRRGLKHDALVIRPQVEPADVVAHNDENIRFLFLRLQWASCADERNSGGQNGPTVTDHI